MTRFKTNLDNAQFLIRLMIKKHPSVVDDVLNSEEWKKYSKTNIRE